jgi:hypothetical protein
MPGGRSRVDPRRSSSILANHIREEKTRRVNRIVTEVIRQSASLAPPSRDTRLLPLGGAQLAHVLHRMVDPVEMAQVIDERHRCA